MAPSKSLTDLDDISIENIMKYLGLKESVTLRQVSKCLLNFVDISKPHINIDAFDIKIQPNAITCYISYYKDKNLIAFQTEYRRYYKGSRIRTYKWREVKRMIEVPDKDFLTAFFDDTQMIWTSRNFRIRRFEVELNNIEKNNTRFLEMLESKLAERTNRIQIKHWDATISKPQDCFPILPFFDPECLKTLSLKIHDKNNKLVIDDITHFDQFKQLEYFGTDDCFYFKNAPIELIIEVQHSSIGMENLSFEEFINIKNILMNLPEGSPFKELTIKSDQKPSVQQMIMELGPMNQGQKWLLPDDRGQGVAISHLPTGVHFELYNVHQYRWKMQQNRRLD